MIRVTFNTPKATVCTEVEVVPRRGETVNIAGVGYVVTAVHHTIADFAQGQSIAVNLADRIDQRLEECGVMWRRLGDLEWNHADSIDALLPGAEFRKIYVWSEE